MNKSNQSSRFMTGTANSSAGGEYLPPGSWRGGINQHTRTKEVIQDRVCQNFHISWQTQHQMTNFGAFNLCLLLQTQILFVGGATVNLEDLARNELAKLLYQLQHSLLYVNFR